MKTQHLYFMKSANKVILLSFVCTILLSSCGYIQLRNNIHSLMNLKIEFPDSMLQFKSDSIDMQIKEICFDKPTIVYWIDSVDCSSCLMNSLYQWETIIEYGKKDSVIFDMAFIVSPPKSESEYFKEVVRHKRLSTPVYIDTENYVAKLNPTLSSQNINRVFLLDKEQCIKAIGDPMLSSDIWDFYRSRIFELNHQPNNTN